MGHAYLVKIAQWIKLFNVKKRENHTIKVQTEKKYLSVHLISEYS